MTDYVPFETALRVFLNTYGLTTALLLLLAALGLTLIRVMEGK